MLDPAAAARVRAYTRADRDAVLDLQARVFGAAAATGAANWTWEYDDNPFQVPDVPLGWIAEIDGRMAGYSPEKTRFLGAALIVLGIAATLAGMWEHRIVLGAVVREDYRYAERPRIARYMGFGLVGVGIVALAMILAGA